MSADNRPMSDPMGSSVPGDTEKGEAVRAELHAVAAQIEAHLRTNGSPPIWYRAIDIVHLAAGCKWDDTAGEDGWGEYDCGFDSSVDAGAQDELGACGKPAPGSAPLARCHRPDGHEGYHKTFRGGWPPQGQAFGWVESEESGR